MHDPNTIAFEIKYPWYEHKPWPKGKEFCELTERQRKGRSQFWRDGYRNTFAVIWHVDPELDGSDDSCGWSSPRLTKKELEKIKKETSFEIKYWFDETPFGLVPKVSAEAIVWQAFQMIAWRLYEKNIEPKHVPQILSLTHNHIDNFTDGFRRAGLREDDVIRSCYFVARAFKRMERPWYGHPRWHVWHWRIQVRPLQELKRWLWGKCCQCGKGFKWGESVTSNSWHGTGPRWFRSESSIYHSWHDGVQTGHAQAQKEG